MRGNTFFIARVTIIHMITYVVCGIIFMNIINYEELFKLGNAQYLMRSLDSNAVILGPLVQVVRGVLFGLVLLIVKNNVMQEKYAWVKIWAIIVVVGMLNTPGVASGSIEAFVYTQLPLEFQLKGYPEVLVQTLLFSVWVTSQKRVKISDNIKIPFTVTAFSALLFSMCGILLSLILGSDISKSASDSGAFVVMFMSLACVFFLTLCKRKQKINVIIYYLGCYIALAVFPTVYNYVTGSVLASPLSLLTSGLPVVAIWVYFKYQK